jgi:hypothetical protein
MLIEGALLPSSSSSPPVLAAGFHLFPSFPGLASLTGSYAVPTGAIRSSEAGFSLGAGLDAFTGGGLEAAGGGGGAAGVGAGGGDGSLGGGAGAGVGAAGVGLENVDTGVETVAA